MDQKSKKDRSPGPVQIRWASQPVTYTASPLKQLHLDQISLDFRDNQSVLYFQEFVYLVQGPWVAAGTNTHFWGVTLPQIARNNKIVRHAAVGIGALSKWYNSCKQEAPRTASMPIVATSEEDSHYFHGLAHYCHALKLQSQQSNSTMQDAMFLSLFFLWFETLRGNRKAALDHINHGMAMLFALLTDQNSESLISSLAPNPKPVIGVVADIFTYLTSQARFILRGRLGQSPILPNFAMGLKSKNHTIESFIIMTSELSQSAGANRSIPAVFDSLDEFEDYWLPVVKSRTAIGPILVEIVTESGILNTVDERIITKFWTNVTGDPRVKEFCEASTRQMQTLDDAFMPLFNRIIMSETESPEYLRALHLRLHYLGVFAFENPTQYHSFETLQQQTPLFREYLSLAETALQSAKRNLKNPAQHISLQCGLACRLLLVAFFCRDPLIRDQATWMLKDYPGHDGIWNARSLFVLAKRNKVVERVNASEGTPAEQWERLWRREYLFENGGDRIIFCYLDKDETTGEWNMVEETADVKGEPENVSWQRRPLTTSGQLLIGDALINLWETSL